jgi:hypothetical protein
MKKRVKKIETILTTISGIVIVVIFISFFPNKQEVLADPRPYPHYHYDPGTPIVPYYAEPSPESAPFFYKDEFTLTVRLILTDKSWKFNMPDFNVYGSGENQYVPSSDFYDDGKVKVQFELDRDDIGWSETVGFTSTDGRYYNSYTYSTVNRNEITVDFKIIPG